MIRFVIYPRFAAGADETDELIVKLADVLAAHHGRAESEDDEVKSVLVVEDDDEEWPDDEEIMPFLTRNGAVRIVLPGARAEGGDPDDPSDEPGEMGHDGTTNEADDRYVISDERLAEIKGLLNDRHAGWQVVPSPGVTVYDLAAAVDDLLCEREDRLG